MANVTVSIIPSQPELITLDSDVEDDFENVETTKCDVGMTCKISTGKSNVKNNSEVESVGQHQDQAVGVGSAWKIQVRWSCGACLKFWPKKSRQVQQITFFIKWDLDWVILFISQSI